jgi:hypothetical protein
MLNTTKKYNQPHKKFGIVEIETTQFYLLCYLSGAVNADVGVKLDCR